MSGDRSEHKRRAAAAAAETVTDGDVVGLGSGSTTAFAIDFLGERVADGLDIVGIPTSTQAADRARTAGVPVRQPADVEGIDIAIDGADQVAGTALIKGGGGAHLREKVIDTAADRFVVVVDGTKVVETLNLPIPLEVLPDARPLVADSIRSLGGDPHLRRHDDYPLITENGNYLLTGDFGTVSDPHTLANSLSRIPGILAHGLFLDCVDAIYVGRPQSVDRITQ